MPQYTEPVIIDGAEDEIQLQVQGHTTQNAPLQTWETSTADTLAQITGDGRLQIGDIGLETDDALIEAHRDDDSAGSAGLPKRGLHSAGYLGGALTSLVSWVVQELTLIGSGSLDAVHEALRVRLTNQNSGTRGTGATLRAGSFDVSNSGGGSGNRLPELTGLRVGVENQASAYVDQAYGVKVEITNNGNANAVYAFHADQGIVRVGDTLEVKRPASVPGTPATDIISMYPKSDGKLYAKNWFGTEYDLTGGGGAGALPQGYLTGFEVNISGTNITVLPGMCRSDDDTTNLKRISSAGNLTINPNNTGANGRDTGTFQADTWYYVFVIWNPTTATLAGLISQSTAPTMPSGYTKKRRIGAARTNSSAIFYKQTTLGGSHNIRKVVYDEATTAAPFRIAINNVPYEPVNGWDDINCNSLAPPTSRMIVALAGHNQPDAQTRIHWRAGNAGHRFHLTHLNTNQRGIAMYELPINSSQVGQVSSQTNPATENFRIDRIGYYDDLNPSFV